MAPPLARFTMDQEHVVRALLGELAAERDSQLATRQKIVSILVTHYADLMNLRADLIAADVSPYVAVLAESTDAEGAADAIALLRYIATPEAIAALAEAAENHPVEEIREQARDAITPPGQ